MKKIISTLLAVSIAFCSLAFGATVSYADEQSGLYINENYEHNNDINTPEVPDQSVISDISVSRVSKTDIEIYWNCSYYGSVDGYEVSLYDEKRIHIFQKLMSRAIIFTAF